MLDAACFTLVESGSRLCCRFRRGVSLPKSSTSTLLDCLSVYLSVTCGGSTCGSLVWFPNSKGFQTRSRPSRSIGFWVESPVPFNLDEYLGWLGVRHPSVWIDLEDAVGGSDLVVQDKKSVSVPFLVVPTRDVYGSKQ